MSAANQVKVRTLMSRLRDKPLLAITQRQFRSEMDDKVTVYQHGEETAVVRDRRVTHYRDKSGCYRLDSPVYV